MGAPGNPFASLEQQQTQAATPDNGNPFAALATQQAPQQQQAPGFLERAYQGSPLPGIFDAAKSAATDFIRGPMQMQDQFNSMVDSLKAGDFKGAVSHAAGLLTGEEDNPFKAAAASVIQGVVKDAHQAGRDIASKNVSAIPVVGTALSNLATDAKAGNVSGSLGDITGGALSLAPMLLGEETNATKAQGAVEGAVDAASEAAGKAKTLVSEDAAANVGQPEVQQAVRDVAKATEPTAVETPSIRSSVESAADQVYSRSKAAYAQLDELTNGRFQRFQDQIRNLQQRMSEVSGIDDSAYEQFELKRNEIETVQDNLIEQLVEDGKLDPKLADQAKADFKQSMALYDLDNAVKASSKGVRPEIAGPNSTVEYLDPKLLDTRLNKLFDSGRLQQAVGDEGAATLIKRVDGALRSRTTAISRAKFIKAALKYTAIGSAALATGTGLSHVLGGGGGR